MRSFPRDVARSLPASTAIRVILIALGLATTACGIEKPESPSFQTEINLPTGTFRHTVADLIHREEQLEGDTTGNHPVYLVLSGQVDSVGVQDRLAADVPAIRLSGSLGDLSREVATTPDLLFVVGEFAPFEIPPEGETMVVPPFEFRPAENDLPAFPEFAEGTIRSGVLQLSLRNDLTFPIENIGAEMQDLASGIAVAHVLFEEPIMPESSAVRPVDLAGKRVSDRLHLRILSGSCPGTHDPVLVRQSDAIRFEVELNDLRFEEITAPSDPHPFEADSSTALDASVRIAEASISSATIAVRLENTAPLPIRLELVLPDLQTEGRPWNRWYDLAPGSPERPSMLRASEVLDGLRIVRDDLETDQQLRYRFHADVGGSGGETVTLSADMGASVEIGAFHALFDEVSGIFEPREVTISPTHTEFELPEGSNELTFFDVSLDLTVVNGVEIPAHLNLTAVGTGQSGSISVPLEGEIEPATPLGPATTHLRWDETDRDLLDLVNMHPTSMAISGSATVGDGRHLGTVHGDDRIRAQYEVRSPMRFRLSTAEVWPDSFSFDIDEDSQTRIRKNAIEAEAVITVENHLPVGASVSFHFAALPEDIRPAPDILLEPVHVSPGRCDPTTGQVVESSQSVVRLALSPEQIPFFARDRVYGGTLITLDSSDGQVLELRTSDYVSLSGVLRFVLRID